MADVIAVEHVGVHAAREEFRLEAARDRRLTRTRQTGEPNDCAAMPILRRARLRGHLPFGPEDVLALNFEARRVGAAEDNPAAGNSGIINDHEATERRHALVIVHYEGRAGLHRHAPDRVARNFLEFS